MSLYPFEYFCGANVTVKLERLPIMEVAGISYEAIETKRPLYGYSSTHFDGVARGQVLIEGTLVVNYVHQDYMYHAVKLALEKQRGGSTLDALSTGDVSYQLQRQGIQSVAQSYPEAVGFIQAMKNRYWVNQDEETVSEILPTYSLHDLARGLDIEIIYGHQDSTRPNGATGELLRGVYFKGRGKRIEISEDVIVEAYSFFARDVYSLRNPRKVTTMPVGNATALVDEAVITQVFE